MSAPERPEPAGDGRTICAAQARLPLQLIVLTQELQPDPPVHPIRIMTSLRCALESHPEGPHYDLIREHDSAEEGAIWARWITGITPSAVGILRDCPADNGAPGADNDACTLFAGHPGGHGFEFSDPEYEAALASPEYLELDEQFGGPTSARPTTD
ncbi:hypothetical protein ABZ714_06180 [Streptomyces sp. NPDC006798]|uniref:hypothetical protein n=1 Tax=Streptomyces sp. NPDC006798 TaxID=3155462 RepID=UPI00340D6424